MQAQLQQCSSSALHSSSGLHSGVRVLTPASTSSVPWRYPAPNVRQHRQQQQQQQQQQCESSPRDSQAFRFKHNYDPQKLSHMSPDSAFAWPTSDGELASVVSEQTRLDPEQMQVFYRKQQSADSKELHNPWSQNFRVSRVPLPVPVSLPGSEYWQVEMLNNYSTSWPSLKFADGKLQFRKGFLEPFDDPKVVPFFFYRGLECLTYSWSDRAFQALFTAVYAGIHLALFGWFWQNSPTLALAVGINWGLGKLSLAKWGILLFLALSDRTWLYFLYLAGKLVDKALAKLFPPVRHFCWGMFTLWMVFVAVTPIHYYPIPFAPFAPGTMGLTEAVL